jgi:hypothetical protein
MCYSAPAQLTFGSQSESSRPLHQPTQCAKIEQHRGRVEQRRGLPRYPAADCVDRLPRPVYDFAALNQLPVLLALQHIACLAEGPQLVVGEHTAAVGIERANNCPDRIGQPGTDWLRALCHHQPARCQPQTTGPVHCIGDWTDSPALLKGSPICHSKIRSAPLQVGRRGFLLSEGSAGNFEVCFVRRTRCTFGAICVLSLHVVSHSAHSGNRQMGIGRW